MASDVGLQRTWNNGGSGLSSGFSGLTLFNATTIFLRALEYYGKSSIPQKVFDVNQRVDEMRSWSLILYMGKLSICTRMRQFYDYPRICIE